VCITLTSSINETAHEIQQIHRKGWCRGEKGSAGERKGTKKRVVLRALLWDRPATEDGFPNTFLTERGDPVPKLTTQPDRTDATREEVVRALLHSDRAQHDELGRTEMIDDPPYHSSPREQAAAPIDLHNVDE
jgi:hypothetical protein